jgi:hypothetical protein
VSSWLTWGLFDSQSSPVFGSAMAVTASDSGVSAVLMWPVPSSSATVSLLARVHRSHNRPASSRPSKPQRSQKKSRVMGAQSRQMGVPPALRPGSSRLAPQPGHWP